MNFLARVITWINVPANAAGRFLLFPIELMPGWLSNTIIAAVTGLLLLVIFKHTSNQRAIGQVRDNIKANMLALKLFKDSISVTLQTQARLFKGALQLLLYAVVPLLVMIVPVSLLLGQLGLWYQSRPLLPGEQAVVIMKLNDKISSPWPEVSIESIPAAEVMAGPFNAFSKRQIYWEIQAYERGYHHIIFKVDQQQVEKMLAVGDGFMRVSAERPGWCWSDILRHPAERPFGPDSVVQSISVNYPPSKRIFGIPWWLIYFFVASFVFALLFRPFLKVKI